MIVEQQVLLVYRHLKRQGKNRKSHIKQSVNQTICTYLYFQCFGTEADSMLEIQLISAHEQFSLSFHYCEGYLIYLHFTPLVFIL